MNIEQFLITLPIMIKGMLGIFIVILAIYGSVILLKKIFPPKENQ